MYLHSFFLHSPNYIVFRGSTKKLCNLLILTANSTYVYKLRNYIVTSVADASCVCGCIYVAVCGGIHACCT